MAEPRTPPPTFSRDVGKSPRDRIRVRVATPGAPVTLQLVTALGPSGVLAPTGRPLTVEPGDVAELISALAAAIGGAA